MRVKYHEPSRMKTSDYLLFALLITPAGVLKSTQAADTIPIAHRGLLRHAPENTLSAFAACLDLGMGFELDLRTAKDGPLVVLHDDNVLGHARVHEVLVLWQGLLEAYKHFQRLRRCDVVDPESHPFGVCRENPADVFTAFRRFGRRR